MSQLSIHAVAYQKQTQTLSPRLQRAVKLLQMSSLEFAQELSDTLGSNPFIDSDAGEELPLPPSLEVLANPLGIQSATSAHEETYSSEHSSAEVQDERCEPPPEVGEWSDVSMGTRQTDAFSSPTSELTQGPSRLADYLHSQLGVLRLPPRDLALASAIVELLDDDGYLRCDPYELTAGDWTAPPASDEEVRIALRRVQSLEPTGVGARTLQECLLLQSKAILDASKQQLVERILTSHLRLVASRDCNALAQRLAVSLEEVQAACTAIRQLDPRPGGHYGAPEVQYIRPDVVARRYRGQWIAVLNPAVVPRMQLNGSMVGLFNRHKKETSKQLAEQLQEARWLVSNVEQRFCTIVAVTQAIMDRQQNFLEYGEMAMKPLSLGEIAESVGVHESTVSRVTCNKYLATPSGVVELKRFFSRAMVMPSGAELSGTAIRSLLRDLIAEESPENPLSDTQIAKLLERQGLRLARRTVTKYRQALRIAPAALRRTLVPA